MARHKILGGKVTLYTRPRSRFWWCETYLAGAKRRESTGEEGLEQAKSAAEEWYLGLRGKLFAGILDSGSTSQQVVDQNPPNSKTFKEAADKFLNEYPVITLGQRNIQYVASHERKLRLHLLPFFGPMTLSEVTPGKVQEYRVKRAQAPKPPSRSTLHKEIVVLRQVLKTGHRCGWIQYVPDLSAPYKTSGKITHRGWFSREEYRHLYNATRKRAQQPSTKRWKWQSEQLHDYVLFMANTGLRPDEASRLEHRDVRIIQDEATNETILLIEVRGKRGLGLCKSTASAVRPLLRLRRRNRPKPTDRLFPKSHRELFNAILDELGLKIDRDGNRRTAYSLRHTYICLRLIEGADIYQIAKNCRTSVEMIEKYYAKHLETTLDAAAINVRRPRSIPTHRRRRRRRPENPKDDSA